MNSIWLQLCKTSKPLRSAHLDRHYHGGAHRPRDVAHQQITAAKVKNSR
jgi:hypothetical protein